MILYRVMDYNKQELLTIQMALGPPTTGSVKVLNHLDQEIAGVQKVILRLDEHAETYEAIIICDGFTYTASIMGVDYASVS
jgi:hypothetical protein